MQGTRRHGGPDSEHPTLGKRVAALGFRSRRRIATAAAVVIAVFLGYHVIAGQNGVAAFQQKRLEDRTLRKQIGTLQQENSQLKAHVDRLQNSPDAIEHEAREILHYTRPGEVIYTMNEKPAENKQAAEKTDRPVATDPSAASATPND